MWRRPRPVTADTKSPAPQPVHWAGGVEPSRRTRQRGRRRDLGRQRHGGARWGGGSWVRGRCHLPRKRGVARYCATRTRLVASGRSANPPHRGSAATKVEKEKNPDGI